MKKIFLSLAVVMGFGLSQINAQEANFGLKAEFNSSNFILSDMDGMKSNLGAGATLGGFEKIEFGENFALQPELLFHFKTSEMETKATGAKLDYRYFGVEIPIYAVGQVKLGSGKGFIGIGPYAGFGIDSRYKADGMDDVTLYKEYNGAKSAMQRWDFGLGGMLGYEFSNGIQINASYKIGFMDTLNADKDNASMQNQTISLGIGYKF
ncbi:MAG: PorT family protein [Tannerella sp.]|jgi:hypothetical protein|nr:PorT family protein [Tannerella sp.]